MHYSPNDITHLHVTKCSICEKEFETEVDDSQKPVCSLKCLNEKLKIMADKLIKDLNEEKH